MNFFRAYIFLSKDLLITLVNYFIWKYSYFDRQKWKQQKRKRIIPCSILNRTSINLLKYNCCRSFTDCNFEVNQYIPYVRKGCLQNDVNLPNLKCLTTTVVNFRGCSTVKGFLICTQEKNRKEEKIFICYSNQQEL